LLNLSKILELPATILQAPARKLQDPVTILEVPTMILIKGPCKDHQRSWCRILCRTIEDLKITLVRPYQT